MCFWGWLYDFIALFSNVFSTVLRDNFNIPNIHIPDAMVSFVLIPFLHLMNDEETKLIIFLENWFEGIKYVFGLREKSNSDGNNVNETGNGR